MKRVFKLFLLIPIIATSCSKTKGMITFYSSGNPFETLYSDSYFSLNNKEFHQEIALASHASIMSGINGQLDYSERAYYLVNLWKQEGFENIFINQDYKEKPRVDSIGFAIASKKIDDFNLVTVTIRSGVYDSEWASNFVLGSTGDAQGFKESSQKVLDGISEYISTYQITGHTKFWLNGYSRGAAITNMMAASILNDIKDNAFISGLNTSLDDIYAYCFETPGCAYITTEEATSDLYKPIHNIMNFNDLVPALAPYEWGFNIYGTKYYFPDRLTDIYFDYSERQKLITNYHFMYGAHKFPEYYVDDWKFYDAGQERTEEKNLPRESLHPSQGRFGRNFVHELTTNYMTRDFYSNFESAIGDIFAAVYGWNENIDELSITGQLLINMILSYPLVQTLFMELQQDDQYGFATDIEFIFYEVFNPKGEAQVQAVRELYDNIWLFVLFMCPGIVSRSDIMLQFFSRDNLLHVADTHFCELNYSFLMSCDERLYGSSACKLNDGTYQVLHVKTPSSITIFENNLRKTVFTYSNGRMSSDCISAEKLADGSIEIYLPNNGSYQYKVDSTSISLGKVDNCGVETTMQESMAKEGHF